MPKLKVLVVHLTAEDINPVVEKIRKLNAKSGPFEHVIILGDIETALSTIDLKDLPPLIALSSHISDTEADENKVLLRKYGIYESRYNIRIAFLGPNDELLESNPAGIIERFEAVKSPVDILISRQWSQSLAEREETTVGNQLVDKITKILKPKYHFAFEDPKKFFELEPFMWEGSKAFTRFINIPTYRSGKKWAYAFSIDPSANTLESPSNTTENPFTTRVTKKRVYESLADMESESKKVRTILPTNCHFCFSNPNVEDHMFISISQRAYLATAKGPLSIPKGEMNFSGHCLIIPIEHIPKLKSAEPLHQESQLSLELKSYEHSIVKMNYRKFDMSTVVFEIHSDKSIHFHKQLIPIPKYLIMRFGEALDRQTHLNNEKFTHNGKLNFMQFSSSTDQKYLGIVNNPESNYLMFTVYETSEASPTFHLSRFDINDKLDLQFGRRVLAYLLRLPNRANWSSSICQQSKKQEEIEVANFQKSYNEFDITKE